MTRRAQPKPPAAGGKLAAKVAKPDTKRSAARAAPSKTPASRVADVASTLVTSRRRNAEALLDAGRKSTSGIVAVLKRRIVILRDTLSELRTVATVMHHVGVRDSATHLDGLARGALQLTLNTVRELSGLAATTQKEALEILARRLQADLAEFRELRSKAGVPRSK